MLMMSLPPSDQICLCMKPPGRPDQFGEICIIYQSSHASFNQLLYLHEALNKASSITTMDILGKMSNQFQQIWDPLHFYFISV